MVNPRKLDRRRKSIRNIRKITRTMELIATARFKKAMDRATAAREYTRRITRIVADLAGSGLELRHPLLEGRDQTHRATLLVLTSNRGLCGGFNSALLRQAFPRLEALSQAAGELRVEISGKRGIAAFRYRKLPVDETFVNFDDRPRFDDVERLATRYLDAYAVGALDRLDVVYTRFQSVSRQQPVVETLLPLGRLAADEPREESAEETQYELLPDAASILDEIVPMSFKVRLFKCFLDSAVSEQIGRMVAMKSASENANEMIKLLSRRYNRARQSKITSELSEIIGGVEALNE